MRRSRTKCGGGDLWMTVPHAFLEMKCAQARIAFDCWPRAQECRTIFEFELEISLVPKLSFSHSDKAKTLKLSLSHSDKDNGALSARQLGVRTCPMHAEADFSFPRQTKKQLVVGPIFAPKTGFIPNPLTKRENGGQRPNITQSTITSKLLV
jgi:hypothetical protein